MVTLKKVFLTTLVVMLGVTVQLRANSQGGGGACSSYVAPFEGGPSAITTPENYPPGLYRLTVSGTGQAAGTNSSDAFYIYTGLPATNDPVLANEFGLYINLAPATTLFVSGQPIPSYRVGHKYSFDIDTPGGQLTFGVGDTFTGDNTGSYTVKVCPLKEKNRF